MKNYTIGIDLGATNIRVASIENAEITQIESEAIIKTNDPADLIHQIIDLIKNVIHEKIESIGIGVPSVVDVEKGIVYDVQNIPAWQAVPLKDILEAEFKIPVFINNDANCFVLGEKYYGSGIGHRSIVGLVLGTGFGAGLIMNNHLVSGANCGAGEVGMLPYKDSIFEHYCSGMFFTMHNKIDGEEAFKRASDKDPAALKMYNDFGTHLGKAMKVVLYAYDPEIIILGGSISSAFHLFKASIFAEMEDFAYSNSLKKLKITCSELEQVAVLGAAALSLDQKIKN